MTPAYMAKLGLKPRPNNIGTQKIDCLIQKTYGMTLASFLLQNSLERVWFFEEAFLLTNINIKIVSRIFFLALNNANIEFIELKKLIWRFYTIIKALSITNRIDIIDKREFANIVLDKNLETFVVHILALETITIHPFLIAHIAILQWNKAPTKILGEYSDFGDIFLIDLPIKLHKNTTMNMHAIKLIDGK